MWRIWAKGRTARIPTKMMQLVAKLRHLDLANALTVGARLGVNIDNEQRVVELAAGGIKPRHKCMLLWWSLHRHSRRWVKRRIWLPERHKFLSVLLLLLLRLRKFQGVVQADSNRRQGQSDWNFIRAKQLGAQPEICCARNFASRHARRIDAVLKMKRRARLKAARRSVSSVREK